MLEDGTVFTGVAAGKFKETVCEVVFNTSMTGYVEMLSDPSNKGLGVVMTYPLIGNYGVCHEDMENEKLFPAALFVHELCGKPSNFRSEMTINGFLTKYSIPCIKGLDTREIVMHIRENGAMKGIVTDDISDKDALLNKIKDYKCDYSFQQDEAKTVSHEGTKLAFLDLGARNSMVNAFAKNGFAVTRFPATTTADEILAGEFEALVISNGAENEEAYANLDEIKKLCDSGLTVFAMGLGHQLVALANGGKIEKMAYGHRGANYPVKFVDFDKTFITSHNHGYTVSEAPANAEVMCVNVNDKTIEGLKYTDKPIISVQFAPDTCKGPNTSFMFGDFMKMVKEGK